MLEQLVKGRGHTKGEFVGTMSEDYSIMGSKGSFFPSLHRLSSLHHLRIIKILATL